MPADPGVARLLGLYPQLQPGLWMQRVKLLGGVACASTWRTLARIARRFSPGTPLHLTTRQEVELHDLGAQDVPTVQGMLAEAGLTGLGACGDTLRNVTVSPHSGIETVELVPLAWQVRSLLEAHEGIFSLPRKFKISFSCGADRLAQPWINDLGLIAERPAGRWGFRVIAGGSLGPRPGTGMRLFGFLGPDDVLPLVLAAIQLFQTHGERKNRARARLRHVRERLGDEAFASMLRQQLGRARQERPWPEIRLQEPAEPFRARTALTFPNGDVSAEAAEALGELAERDDLRIRIANHHRILVFGRSADTLAEAMAAHAALAPAAKPQLHVVACPGKRWCKRALTDTNGLADRIRRRFEADPPPGVTVCISGCPNGCAQSAVADIGLVGVLARRNGKTEEAFNLLAGGGMGRDATLARPVARKLPAELAIDQIAGLLAKGS